jgi:methylsterol monooxygenase
MSAAIGKTAMQVVDQYFPALAPHLQTLNATEAQFSLYGSADLSHLNWLERSWASYYIWVGNPIIATGLLSFLVHEVRSASPHAISCADPPGRLLWPLHPMAHH